MSNLENGFADYRQNKPNATAIEVSQARHAFYAGALVMHAAIARILPPGHPASERLYSELVAFKQSLQQLALRGVS